MSTIKTLGLGLVFSVGTTVLVTSAVNAVLQEQNDINEINELIDKYDENKDGNLSLLESTELVYKEYDADKNKYISMDEGNNVIQKINRMKELHFKEASRGIFSALQLIDIVQMQKKEEK